MAFGTKFPPKFWYPSKVHRYKPFRVPLQTRPSAAARAVVDVPGAIVTAKHTNAQAKARELIMIFVNFVFIVVFSFCLSVVVLAFFDLLFREESFLAVHWSTWQDLAIRYAKSLEDTAIARMGIRSFW